MKSAFLSILTIMSIFLVYGNEGFRTYGTSIYPSEASNISIEKEVISFTVKDGIAYVDIQMEFFNPSTTQKLLLVFEAPIYCEDLTDSGDENNKISDFKIVHNKKSIPFDIKVQDCSECPLKDLKDFEYNEYSYCQLNYFFELTFQPGLNTLNQSFSFPNSGEIDINNYYKYVLPNKEKWGDGKIKDLTVVIDMGYNQYFHVVDIFGKDADWSIIGGEGKVTDVTFNYMEENPYRMIRTIDGKVQIKAVDFDPIYDIDFGTTRSYFFTHLGSFDAYDIYAYEALVLDSMDLNTPFTKEELRILRNTIYAQNGYVFKSSDLNKYFKQFNWYMPNPDLKMEDVKLSDKEIGYISIILSEENKIK